MLKKFMLWSLFAWYAGSIFFFVSFYCVNGVESVADSTGKIDGLWTAGFTSLTALWIIHNTNIFIATRNFSIVIILGYLLAMSGFFPFTVLLDEYT